MARPRSFDEPSVMLRARDAFHDHGYTATSVEQLTAATGLQRSSLYGAFGDKHGLFMRTFSQYCEEEMQLIERELGGDHATPLARLAGHFQAKTSDSGASQRGCLLAKTTAELAGHDPEVAGMASDFYAGYRRALTACAGEAQAAGEIRDDLDAPEVGVMLLSVLRGIEALGRAGASTQALQAVSETTLASLAPVRRPLTAAG